MWTLRWPCPEEPAREWSTDQESYRTRVIGSRSRVRGMCRCAQKCGVMNCSELTRAMDCERVIAKARLVSSFLFVHCYSAIAMARRLNVNIA